MKAVSFVPAALVPLIALGVTPAWSAGVDKTAGGGGAASQSQVSELSELRALKDQIESMRAEYEGRIKELEARFEALQAQMLRSSTETPLTPAAAPQPSDRSVQAIPGALNPAISAIGNFLARGDSAKVFNEEGDRIDNRQNLREVEIDMRVPVDPYADAVLITSFESETPGRFSLDVEEAYVNLKKLPFLATSPLGLRIKVGRFRPILGKFNVLHTHDLPQSQRPLPIQEFLGEEGFIQNGISGNLFIPTPWDERSSLDATLEILNGGDIAIAPSIDSRTSYLGHLRWFRTFKDAHNLELGWSSYYRPSGNAVSSANLHGFDFTYRWKPLRLGQWKSFLLGGETLFTRSRQSDIDELVEVSGNASGAAAEEGRPKGVTLFGQWQFNRRTYAGLRWDRTDAILDPGAKRRSITPYLSYYFSEFLRFRLNYERRWSDLAAENRRNSVFLELNWVFGSHPPEPFWVNK